MSGLQDEVTWHWHAQPVDWWCHGEHAIRERGVSGNWEAYQGDSWIGQTWVSRIAAMDACVLAAGAGRVRHTWDSVSPGLTP